MKSMANYGNLSPLLFMTKMMVRYFVSNFIRVMTIIILVEIFLFFIDMNSEVWFLLYGYIDGVATMHNWEQLKTLLSFCLKQVSTPTYFLNHICYFLYCVSSHHVPNQDSFGN
jgi:hypothetical protein